MIVGIGGFIFTCIEAVVNIFVDFQWLNSSTVYGLETNDRFSLLGVFISAVILFKGFTAYAMWTERSEAMLLGTIDAILGMVICILVMALLPFIEFFEGTNELNFRIELLFLIPYLIACMKRKEQWENFKPVPSVPDEIIDQVAVSYATPKQQPVAPIEASKIAPTIPKSDLRDKEDPERFMPK